VRIRIGSAAAVLVFGVSGLLMALPGTAGADSSTSPPTTAVPTSCSSSTTINLTASNTSSNPATTSVSSTCAFAPGATVQITFLGATQSATADATTGILTLSLSATDPALSVNGGAFQTTTFGASNTITAVGNNASGAANTATFLVVLSNPSATGANGLAFTGADLAALIGAALVLILMGAGVVIFTRRRAAATQR